MLRTKTHQPYWKKHRWWPEYGLCYLKLQTVLGMWLAAVIKKWFSIIFRSEAAGKHSSAVLGSSRRYSVQLELGPVVTAVGRRTVAAGRIVATCDCRLSRAARADRPAPGHARRLKAQLDGSKLSSAAQSSARRLKAQLGGSKLSSTAQSSARRHKAQLGDTKLSSTAQSSARRHKAQLGDTKLSSAAQSSARRLKAQLGGSKLSSAAQSSARRHKAQLGGWKLSSTAQSSARWGQLPGSVASPESVTSCRLILANSNLVSRIWFISGPEWEWDSYRGAPRIFSKGGAIFSLHYGQ